MYPEAPSHKRAASVNFSRLLPLRSAFLGFYPKNRKPPTLIVRQSFLCNHLLSRIGADCFLSAYHLLHKPVHLTEFYRSCAEQRSCFSCHIFCVENGHWYCYKHYKNQLRRNGHHWRYLCHYRAMLFVAIILTITGNLLALVEAVPHGFHSRSLCHLPAQEYG